MSSMTVSCNLIFFFCLSVNSTLCVIQYTVYYIDVVSVRYVAAADGAASSGNKFQCSLIKQSMSLYLSELIRGVVQFWLNR